MNKVSRLLAALAAAMLLITGCTKEADETVAAPTGAPTGAPGTELPPEAATETEQAAAEKSYDQIGISVALPAGWEETTAPKNMDMGDTPSVAFKQTGQEYPVVVISGMDKSTYDTVKKGLATKGEDALKAMTDGIKQSLASTEGGQPGKVLAEEEWSGAEGIAKGWKARVQGRDKELGKEITGDIIVAEATAGGMYILMVQALDAAGADTAKPVIDGIKFTTPSAPTAAPTADATPSDTPAPAGE